VLKAGRGVALCAALSQAGGAAAQAVAPGAALFHPGKPIRIVVPSSAGGSTDFVSRQLARKLTEALVQTVVVDFRPGAGSVIGTDLVAKAAPDGHTLLAAPASLTISPSLYQLPFDPLRDLAPISLLAAFPNILVVHPSLPVKSVGELIALAKARPGRLHFGSSGIATGTHLSMELLRYTAGINLVHVPYKGGAPGIIALLNGEVQVNFATITTALPHVRTGRLRALAVSTTKRSSAAPSVPTVSEAGVKDYEYASWIGLLAPSGTPRPIIARLHAESVNAVQTREMQDIFTAEGSEAVGNTPEEFSVIVRTEVARWMKVIKAAGIKSE